MFLLFLLILLCALLAENFQYGGGDKFHWLCDNPVYSQFCIDDGTLLQKLKDCDKGFEINHTGLAIVISNAEPTREYSFRFAPAENKFYYPHPPPLRVTLQPEPNILNPKIVVEKYGRISVIRDDLLYGGTKQRGLIGFIRRVDPAGCKKIIMYAGPPQGIAQVAIGMVAKVLGLRAKMIYSAPNDKIIFPLSEKARKIGVEVVWGGAVMRDAQNAAAEMARNDPSILLLPFGLNDENFHAALAAALVDAVPAEIREREIFMFVVAGSFVLLRVLYEIFPRAYFFAVRVGKDTYWHKIDPTRTRILRSNLTFGQCAKIQPPYASVGNYDAKVWEFANAFESDGREVYICNVASE